jgi:preprotein translocase subunit SecG
MEIILRIFQVFLAVGLIGVVLLQQSEGGGLGIGSSGGAGSFMSVRGSANFLTRVTSIFGGLFMVTCLAMAILAKPSQTQRSIFDSAAGLPAAQTPSLPPVDAPPVETAPSSVSESPAVSSPNAEAPQPSSPAAQPPAATVAPVTKQTQPAAKKSEKSTPAQPRGQ